MSVRRVWAQRSRVSCGADPACLIAYHDRRAWDYPDRGEVQVDSGTDQSQEAGVWHAADGTGSRHCSQRWMVDARLGERNRDSGTP